MAEQREICGFVPPTPGYAPCTRNKGHDGPCAHDWLTPGELWNPCGLGDAKPSKFDGQTFGEIPPFNPPTNNGWHKADEVKPKHHYAVLGFIQDDGNDKKNNTGYADRVWWNDRYGWVDSNGKVGVQWWREFPDAPPGMSYTKNE